MFTPGMALDPGEDVNALRNMVHRRAQDRVRPRAAQTDRENAFPNALWPGTGGRGLPGLTAFIIKRGRAGFLTRLSGRGAALGQGTPAIRPARRIVPADAGAGSLTYMSRSLLRGPLPVRWRGPVMRQDAAGAVLCTSGQAMVQAHQAVRALGGTGFLSHSVVSRLVRDAKLMEIRAGTSEIRHMLIGRQLMEIA